MIARPSVGGAFGSRSKASLVLKAEKPLNATDALQILDE
jgi:hypothetical protein